MDAHALMTEVYRSETLARRDYITRMRERHFVIDKIRVLEPVQVCHAGPLPNRAECGGEMHRGDRRCVSCGAVNPGWVDRGIEPLSLRDCP